MGVGVLGIHGRVRRIGPLRKEEPRDDRIPLARGVGVADRDDEDVLDLDGGRGEERPFGSRKPHSLQLHCVRPLLKIDRGIFAGCGGLLAATGRDRPREGRRRQNTHRTRGVQEHAISIRWVDIGSSVGQVGLVAVKRVAGDLRLHRPLDHRGRAQERPFLEAFNRDIHGPGGTAAGTPQETLSRPQCHETALRVVSPCHDRVARRSYSPWDLSYHTCACSLPIALPSRSRGRSCQPTFHLYPKESLCG
jgi:hypothetical protein